jgi:sortase A
VTIWRLLRGIGRVLVTAGALILLFVGYQLWGTSVHADIAQGNLEDDFEVVETDPEVDQLQRQIDAFEAAEGQPLPEDQLLAPPATGSPMSRIEIPAIGVDWIVVEGVGLDQLKDGPGHYQGTPYPGQAGNVAIAGHRTTYGQPFHNVDQLKSGDEIILTTAQGEFVYTYRETQIVDPSQVEVLEDFGDNRLTLTACHPKYSARQRIVITAALTNPNPAPVIYQDNDVEVVSLDDADLSGQDADRTPAILWAFACASIWLAAWLVGRAWRKWPSYVIGLPFFAVALYAFFENFSRLLPSNY